MPLTSWGVPMAEASRRDASPTMALRFLFRRWLGFQVELRKFLWIEWMSSFSMSCWWAICASPGRRSWGAADARYVKRVNKVPLYPRYSAQNQRQPYTTCKMESPHEHQQNLLLSRIITNVEKLNEAVVVMNKSLQDINIQNMNVELVAQMFKNYQSNVLFHLEATDNLKPPS
ncbi:hypothetical protein NM208_g15743 [Fusarium decemcellulare]|uniref:Uncharacterized protein n=1 Tax=Fusarium decemcellulare TaxID=57161 RepID=A0ACC1RE13_9HYPO|nr:hypothetical protein NM208_g15743 [Fusarium decemcellulare]